MAQLGLAPSSKSIWGFDPRTIGSCALWLDGADINTLFQNTAGTTPITANGQSVNYWTDKSGQGNNATSLTSGSGNISGTPVYSSSPTGVTFTSASSTSGQGMYCALSSSTGTVSGFVVLVDSNLSPAYASTIIGGTTAGPVSATGGRQWRISGGQQQMNNGGVTSGQTATLNAFISNKGLINFVDTGATPLNYYEFGTQLTTAGTYNATYTSPRITTVGCRGGGTAYGEFLNGTILELIVYNSTLGTQARQQIEGYLAWKWGLQASLSVSHPFYSSGTGLITRPFARQFQPVDIPNCALWMDLADATTVTLSGSNITRVADKSGNGLTMTNTGTIAYNTAAQNGLNTGTFSSNGVYLSTSTTNFDFGTTDFYFFAACKTASTSSGLYPIVSKNYASTVNSWMFWRNNASAFATLTYSGSILNLASSAASSSLASTWYVASAGCIRGTSTTVYSNGAAGTSSGMTSTSNAPGSVAILIGGTSGLTWGGQLGEVIIYSGSLSNAQRQQVEAYLGWKWGLITSFSSTYSLYKVPANTSVPFNPRFISGVVLWLDAADISTISLSGSNVTQWNDKSGNSDNAVQATAGNQPTYANSAVTFNAASSQYMTLSSPSTLPNGATPNGTYFFVSKLTSGSAVQALFMYGPTTLATGANPQFYYNSSNQLVLDTFGAGGTTDGTAVLNSTVIFSNTIANSGGTGTVTGWRNSNSFGPTTYTTASITSQKGFIGVTQTGVGTSGTLAYYLTGNIYEIVIYNSVLTTSQRQQVEGYLAWKWRLQTSLPTTHSFYKLMP